MTSQLATKHLFVCRLRCACHAPVTFRALGTLRAQLRLRAWKVREAGVQLGANEEADEEEAREDCARNTELVGDHARPNIMAHSLQTCAGLGPKQEIPAMASLTPLRPMRQINKAKQSSELNPIAR